MIPFELLPIITAHLSTPTQPSPVMFDIPLSYQLHRLIRVPLLRAQGPTLPTHATSPHPSRPLPSPQASKPSKPNNPSLVNLFWNQKFIRKALASSSPKPSTGFQAASYSLSVSSTLETRASASPYTVMIGKKNARLNSVSRAPAPHRLSTADYSSRLSSDSEKVGHHLAQ